MMHTSSRDAVFLEEMGVGPLWRLRDAVGEDAAPAQPPRAEAAAAPTAAPPAAVAPAPAPAPAPAIAPVPAAAVPEAVPVPAQVPVSPAAAAAPASVPVPVPVPVPASAPAMDEDSTAWFDDAPAPAMAPPVSEQAIAAMDWPALQAAAATCTRCALCHSRKGVVFGRGDRGAGWMLVASAPNRADERAAQAVSGAAGKLLDNMMLAAGVDAQHQVYVTNLVKCRPVDEAGAQRAPTAAELAACRPYLERELALSGARTVLTLGQAAAAGLLGAPAASRGVVRRLAAAFVVATYHPGDMLGQGDSKARAWSDLCLARGAHAASD